MKDFEGLDVWCLVFLVVSFAEDFFDDFGR